MSEWDAPAGWSFVRLDRIGFKMFREESRPFTHAANTYSTQRISNINATEHKPKPTIAGGTSAFERYATYGRAPKPAELAWLSANLGLPVWAMSAIPMQFVECDDHSNRAAFMLEERDAAGKVIGYHLRYPRPFDGPDGKDNKRTHGARGLFIPSAWDATASSTDAIYLCEGVTDLLTLAAMGLTAIGRSNNAAGAEHLSQLLRAVPPSRPVIVLADNDQAGRDGAAKLADQLAAALGRPILVMTTPAKDSRASFHAACGERGGETVAELAGAATVSREFAAGVGERFAAACAETVRVYSPAMADIGAHLAERVAVATLPTLDFTAVECAPPPDTLPSAERGRCHHPRGVLMRNHAECRSRLYWFDCKRLGCEHCGKRKREQWQASVQDRLSHHGEHVRPTVYQYTCAAKHWASLSRNLRDHHANYFRLETEEGRFLVVSTHDPNSSFAEDVTDVTTAAASARLCTAIDNLPSLREKALTYSRPWKLVGEQKNSAWQGWKRISKIASTQRAMWEVLEFHKVDWKPVSQHGTFWSWLAWQWHDNQVNGRGGYKRLYDDLTIGEVLPDVDMFGNGDPDASESAAMAIDVDEPVESSTRPPPVGVWVDW